MHPRAAELRAMSDEELVARLDDLARGTQVGTQFYLDELRRRERTARPRPCSGSPTPSAGSPGLSPCSPWCRPCSRPSACWSWSARAADSVLVFTVAAVEYGTTPTS